MPQITALRLVAHAGSPTMSEICALMSASPSTVAGIVDRLEAAGIVARSGDGEDRRSVRVSLSPAGARQTELARRALGSCFADAFAGVPAAGLKEIERGVKACSHSPS